MSVLVRIERALADALAVATGADAPAGLSGAMRHAIFPGGARIRPRLCLAVASACGDRIAAERAEAPAVAIELLHCASLVHDDLPCFDDAVLRRGRPAVHRMFGAPLAVLAGDALIVLAFETLSTGAVAAPAMLGRFVAVIARAAGSPHGLVAGQAFEGERDVALARYQRAKTASLFAAATEAGAIAAERSGTEWRRLGLCLGEAYQVADDIRDLVGTTELLGKAPGRDAALGRPSAALAHGIEGASRRLDALLADAEASIPPCGGADRLRTLMREEVRRLLPDDLATLAA